MPNQSENQQAHALSQGSLPPLTPDIGDLWMDSFDTLHVWQGYYWVKVQGSTMETPHEAVLIGNYNGRKVYYGFTPPEHAENLYWMSNPKIDCDSEVYESVPKTVTGSSSTAVQAIFKSMFTARVWKNITDQTIITALKGLIDKNYLQDYAKVPEVNLAPEKCDDKEAAEKFEAFEKIVEPTGRLDTIWDKLDSLYLFTEKHLFTERSDFKLINWKEPDYKVIPPQEPGLIKQIQQAHTYDNLTEENLLKFIETLKFKS